MEEKKFKLEDCFQGKKSLEEYLKEKAKCHNSYKLYGTEEKLKAIYDDYKLYLSDGSQWNDISDREALQIEDKEYKYFARSFTYSLSENVAMWMLYGGIMGDGVMVDFGAGNLKSILNQCNKVILGTFINKKFEGKIEVSREDFQLYMMDIIYYEPSANMEGYIDVKRSYESLLEVPEKYIKNLLHSTKNYAWSYENECRLILKVKKVFCRNCSDAEINFEEIFKQNPSNKKSVVYESPNYKGSRRYEKSKLYSKINWDLCSGCKK